MAFGRVALARFRHLAKFIPAASGGGQARAFLLFSFTCDWGIFRQLSVISHQLRINCYYLWIYSGYYLVESLTSHLHSSSVHRVHHDMHYHTTNSLIDRIPVQQVRSYRRPASWGAKERSKPSTCLPWFCSTGTETYEVMWGPWRSGNILRWLSVIVGSSFVRWKASIRLRF